MIWSEGKSEHGAWLKQQRHCEEFFTRLRSYCGFLKKGKWQRGRCSTGDKWRVRRVSPPCGNFAGCRPVCQPSQLQEEPEKTEAGDNRRLGAFSSKCKLSHLSAIDQAPFQVAENQTPELRQPQLLISYFYWYTSQHWDGTLPEPQTANKAVGEKWDWHQRTASAGGQKLSR